MTALTVCFARVPRPDQPPIHLVWILFQVSGYRRLLDRPNRTAARGRHTARPTRANPLRRLILPSGLLLAPVLPRRQRHVGADCMDLLVKGEL